MKVDLSILFPKELFPTIAVDFEKRLSLNFSETSYEEKIPELIDEIGDDLYSVIECMKELYDIGLLSSILKGYQYLSEARVAEYEKHRKDLRILKDVIRAHCSPEQYDRMFRSDEPGSYSAYVNSVNTGKPHGKHRRNMKGRTQKDFFSNVKALIKTIEKKEESIQNSNCEYILREIEQETFMPKQLTASNGVIPNQVHQKEMEQILKNAEGYLPFLLEKDESGLTVSQRIVRLFTFSLPYYIGPVSENSEKNSGNGWVVRKETGEVLPWNLEEKIDISATSQKFIEQLIRDCTYISGEKVLPKSSLLYERYCVLNEINNIRIDGERIPVELKQDIYTELFLKGKRVTKKQLESYLIGRGVLVDASQLSGIDIAINNNLSSYGKLKPVLGELLDTDDGTRLGEELIRWSTIYGDSKKMLRRVLDEQYPSEQLNSDQKKRIMGFRFKDWGRLSKEFLELQGCNKETGELVSLIQALWDTNYNLMELLNSDSFTFHEALLEKQATANKLLQEIKPGDFDELYFSAPVKRMVWQTVLLLQELETLLGCAPKHIFLEMTRSEDEKGEEGRKHSRGKQLLELYKNIKDSSRDWKKEIAEADENGSLRSKKLYLYYTQMGKCMYTGRPIDLDALMNDNRYDIDHIYPRHYVKDDNINNNLVLVEKEKNAHKSYVYPLEQEIVSNPNVRELWFFLLEKGLMTQEKYKRLTNRSPFSEEQKAGFIARQLVETSQGTKGVADLLKQLLPDTTIVYAKASNVSEFRNKRDILKSRLVNDFHHAHDAYLNIVVGNVYFVKFTLNPRNFIREYIKDEQKYHYNLDRMFDWDVVSVQGNEVAWRAPSKENRTSGTIAVVKKTLARNTPLLTRMNYVGHGGIANETLYGAEKAKDEGYIPLKSQDSKLADVSKYGGFSSASTAYLFLVEHEVKGKRIRTLEMVPIYLKEKIDENKEALSAYCEDTLMLKNPDIRLPRIKIQSLLMQNGYYMHISGRTGNRLLMRNAVELCLNQKWINYIKGVENSLKKEHMSDSISKSENVELYQILCEKHMNGIYASRPNPVGERLSNSAESFYQLDIKNQCEILLQILQLSAIGVTCADLSQIGGAKTSGKMLISKKLPQNEDTWLINQSVTGIFESRVNLRTI